MKTIVISDLHLTKKFNESKFQCLYKILNSCDRVILNGDFWSHYSITFDDFLKSKWNELFPLLKERKTVYLYGNHDESRWCDKRVNVYSVEQGYKYVLKTKSNTFHIQHGHKLLPHKFIQNEKYVKVIRSTNFDDKVRYPFEMLGDRYFGVSKRVGRRLNNKIRPHSRKRLDGNNYLVIGHTHAQEISKQDHFISTGFVEFGVAQYLEINNESFKLMQKHY